ncbi:DUF1501 domain-containing protein [Fuerstiella marisgermanici]|uniref:DUF1501 domain-containing protein n=1 Tax=Fuerstiella marisgermanici TaxID=1891926 RepID=A0A1P8WFZ3_9PLAN|nr:DUF1501 domain-containing protein [Fuerstiella marisgermanici]APZ92957.1 hypothetical protein Fuma_02569 [Fuerstiella marisgermanici]
MTTPFSRRRLLGSLAAGIGGISVSGWFPALAAQLAEQKERKRHCILLWMSGGPTQTDTWDMKPNHENGGEFKEIQTASPGLRFSEHLPKLAAQSDKLAVMRGLSTKEGDHGRGTYLMRTGRVPMGPIQYPCIGSALANQLGTFDAGLPSFVSVGPYRAFNQDAFGAGFLGPRFGPLIVGASDIPGSMSNDVDGYPELRVQGMNRSGGITEARMEKRLKMWKGLQSSFLAKHKAGAAATQNTVYEGAVRLMNSEDAKAFDLSDEPEALREAYGKTVFGQGCLMARRLIERGVSFIEVSLGTNSGGIGWDTHSDNFTAVQRLSTDLDNGWATLMTDLEDRGLLESTTILWMGEFGRTPQINDGAGRDHFPAAWSAVLAGGGIAGGQAYGSTSEDGMMVKDGKIAAEDLLATLVEATGVGSDAMLINEDGRPIPIAEGTPVKEVLA